MVERNCGRGTFHAGVERRVTRRDKVVKITHGHFVFRSWCGVLGD